MTDFKEINGFPGYSITADGRVWSHKRKKYLKLRQRKDGYIDVQLSYAPGKTRQPLVHTLVAKAFIPNPDGLTEVNHKNGDKSVNAASNLEWSNRTENMQHACKNGLRNTLCIEQIKEIRSLILSGIKYADIAKTFNVSKATISRINTGIAWSYI